MQFFKILLMALIFSLAPFSALSAEHASTTAAAASHAPGAAHHELPAYAPRISDKLPITNSMIVTWAVALGLIILAQLATRNIKEVPEGLQNFWEWMVEGLHNFLE